MGLIITVINAIITVLIFAVFIYTLLRFFMDPYHPLIHALSQVIEPMLAPIRKYVPPMGGFDFSPLIFIIVLQVLGSILTALLRSIG
jgi:YggT family protein